MSDFTLVQKGKGRGIRQTPAGRPTPTLRPGSTNLNRPTRITETKTDQSQVIAEQELVRKTESLSLAPLRLMERPNFGRVGKPVPINANYFAMRIHQAGASAIVVQRYDVQLLNARRKIDREEMRRIFWEVVRENSKVFANQYQIVYDDANCCYSLSQLSFPGNVHQYTFHILLQLDADNRPTEYELRFQFTGRHLVDLSKSSSPDSVQIVDMIVNQGKKHPFLEAGQLWCAWGRGVFRKPGIGVQPMDLGSGQELWRGYQASAKIGQGWKPFLNIDVANTAFFKQQSLLEYMCDILEEKCGSKAGGASNSRGPSIQKRMFHVKALSSDTSLSQQWMDFLTIAMKSQPGGLKLRTIHLSFNRTYKFRRFAPAASQLKFMRGEVETSVADYFAQQHQPLKFPHLPCIQVGSEHKKTFIPMECLEIQPCQKMKKKLSDQQVASVIRASARPAPERKAMIEEMARHVNPSKDPFMLEFGLQMKLQMVELIGRKLPDQTLKLAAGKTATVREGVWDARGGFYRGAKCSNYSLMSFLPQASQPMLEKFCSNLMLTANAMGMSMPKWPSDVIYARSVDDIKSAMNRIKDQGIRQESPAELVFIVMPDRNPLVYSEVKRWGDVELGLMTQCILRKNADNIASRAPGPQAATAVNVSMKLNAKLGGINSSLETAAVWNRISSPHQATLFLGVDVTHPGAGDASPSVGAVVGNVDLEATRWGVTVKVQRYRREHMVYMEEEATARLLEFYKETKVKPARIVIYRDGVSEGQFDQVLKEEMEGVRRACISLDPSYRPPITYIVVQKRHHTRLFPRNPSEGVGRMKNVAPGTVLDTGITHPTNFDFYLLAHAGIQGTARPTHYYVLHDENGFSADDLQMATYQLCHLYARCARVVSIPAPVYYADLACTRARSHVRNIIGAVEWETESTSSSSSGSSRSDSPPTDTETVSTVSSDHELKQSVKVHSAFLNRMYFV